jgi:amino acid adenylation domain-containing protein
MASNVELGRESFLDSRPSIPMQDRISAESGTELQAASGTPDTAGEPTLSVAQQHLWCVEQFASGKPINNVATVLEITGTFDVVALERAVAHCVQRHPMLRTVVENREGRPVARLRSAVIDISVSDLTEFPESERERAAQRIANAAGQDRFDVESGPLHRFQVLRLGPEVHWLVVAAHRIVLDELSMQTLHRELAGAYSAAVEGRSPSVAIEIAKAEKGFSEVEDIGYWTRKLAGRIPALDLSTDRSRPPLQTYNGAIVPMRLSEEICTQVEAFARREAVSLQSVLLAAYATVLHRYSGQEDIVIGTRTRGGGRPNVLAMRNNVSGDMPFRDLLQRVRQTAMEAEAHHGVPFERLVEALRIERDPSRSPLFQVMLDLRDSPDDVLIFGRARASVREIHTGTARYDLSLSLSRTSDGIGGFVEFNPDLFGATTIERFRGHFETLLRGAIEDPSQIVGRLPLLTAAEREQILVTWNGTERPFPQDKCVAHLFEEQVERTPDKIAIAFEDRELTYRQVNGRANSIAAHLKALGAGPDARVGICVGRSVEMLAGMLGILKAGAAYVPLDPTYPKERLAFMVEDAQIHSLLTTRELAGGFAKRAATTLVCIEEILPTEATGNVQCEATPENLAYVIYTSGSTGKPKGVMIRHRNVVNFFAGMDDVLDTVPGTWLAVTSICFDIHVLELLWTLARGFKVVIQSDDAGMRAPAPNSARSVNPNAMIEGYTIPEQIVRHGVTHFQCTPSLMGMLLQEPGARSALAKLDTVLLGGEALTPALVGQLSGPRRIVNVYGPTETTVWSTSDVVDPGSPITVGRPLANTTIYILDRFGEPTPVGVPGELFIGGAGVVRGYHNRPELTAERFVVNPFSEKNGGRMYRTGDLAKYRAGGKIDFLGRMDYQVKLRGFRIELGEIETALRQLPGLRDAVVVVRELSATDKRLAAYLVADGAMDVAQVRSALKERLPDYMVPSLYTFLPALPLTPNGKVDRKALPEPEGLRTEAVAPLIAPRSEMERKLADLWREVLGVETIGIDDSFFDLGGRSISLLQAQARIAATWGREMPIAELLQRPTIAGVARWLGDKGEEAAPQGRAEGRVLDDAEKQKLLFEWNRTELEYSRESCIHALFEAQVERTPDAVAAIFGGEEITYRELNRRANQLAHHLRALGVGPDVFVGLCVERSFALLVGALGIFKAGGAYVPLDWTYPPERVRFMLEDTKAPLVVTQSTLLKHLPVSSARLVCLDSDWERIAEHSTGNPQKIGRSGDMAYVMYTSGSTGVSKGVALEHRSAVSFIHWAREVFSSEELAGVLASTSVCFDLSIFELFVPLSWGGAVVLADNAVNLPTLPPGRSITLINTVPSAIKDLLKKSAIPSTVTVVNLAGEKLRTQVVNQLYALPHIRKVYDLYGPSEATTYATWTLRAVDGPATVGRPVANTQIYILDAAMQLCPIGATGEIYIGGDCLAREYINRPELTAERFIPNPFAPATRLYKTGDLGRYFSDGNIEFLGRKDQQVKIRGFRIELGEIEAVLAEHPQVQECVAAVRDDSGEEKQLVAFIVPRTNSITSTEVRRFLRERLPDYMVPTAYVTLTALPLTANGKVDRKALPALTTAISLPEEGRESRQLTPVQEAVSEIWRNVLGIERVGLHDDFFDLGGHSVLVTQITSRVRQVFDVELSMRHLFGAPTVAALAQIVEERLEEQLREMSQEELHHLAAGNAQGVA